MEIPGKKSLGSLAAVILAATCLGFAHKAPDRGVNVTFGDTMEFNNGATLPAGTYKMEVPENTQTPQVEFSQDGSVKATVPAKVATEATKNSDTEIDSVAHGNAQLVTKIRPKGWDESLLFGSGHSPSTTGQ